MKKLTVFSVMSVMGILLLSPSAAAAEQTFKVRVGTMVEVIKTTGFRPVDKKVTHLFVELPVRGKKARVVVASFMNTHFLNETVGHPSLSTDGRIVFTDSSGTLALYDIKARTLRKLTHQTVRKGKKAPGRAYTDHFPHWVKHQGKWAIRFERETAQVMRPKDLPPGDFKVKSRKQWIIVNPAGKIVVTNARVLAEETKDCDAPPSYNHDSLLYDDPEAVYAMLDMDSDEEGGEDDPEFAPQTPEEEERQREVSELARSTQEFHQKLWEMEQALRDSGNWPPCRHQECSLEGGWLKVLADYINRVNVFLSAGKDDWKPKTSFRRNQPIWLHIHLTNPTPQSSHRFTPSHPKRLPMLGEFRIGGTPEPFWHLARQIEPDTVRAGRQTIEIEYEFLDGTRPRGKDFILDVYTLTFTVTR